MSVEEALSHVGITTRDNYGIIIGGSNSGYINYESHYHEAPPTPIREAARPRVLPLRTLNPLFLGRTAELAELESVLPLEDAGEDDEQRGTNILIVQGLGGSGKSELSLRYLKLHDQKYWAIFWIDASSEKTLIAGFEQIGKQLGLRDADVATVCYELSGRKEQWLLVIDNADDPELDLSPYLPDQGGNVIITTRNPELAIFGTESVLRVDGLAEGDALALLYKAARIPVQQQEASRERANEILKVLDNHTLAIIQAGAYIRRTRDLDGYVKFFNEQRRLVLEYCAPQARAQYGSVYATFEISASRLHQESLAEQESAADALDLLNLFAFMDTKGSFEQIFCDAKDFADMPFCPHGVKCELCTDDHSPRSSDAGIVLEDIVLLARRHAQLLPNVAYPSGQSLGKHRWREACNKLYQYSLLTFETADGEEILTFHPLVLSWALARQTQQSQWQSWRSVATAIFLGIHGDINDAFSPRRDRLSVHARVCAGHVVEEWWRGTSNLEFMFLLHVLGWILVWNRDDSVNSKIVKCLEAALEAVEQGRVQLAVDVWQEVEALMGRQAFYVGDFNKSSALFERVVKAREPRSVGTDFKLLHAQHELAMIYRFQGQTSEAIRMFEHVVRVRKQVLPETDRECLASQHELAGALLDDRQIAKAIQIMQHVTAIRNKLLDKDHPDRLVSTHRLAMAYHDNAQLADAIALLEEVVEIKTRTLAENNSDRLESMHELARAYSAVGRVPEAIPLLEHVVQVWRQTLSETHASRLTAMHTLGVAYHRNGQSGQAVELLRCVVDIEDKALAETDIGRTTTERELARAYRSHGDMWKAMQTIEHVVRLERLGLSEDDPDRLEDEALLRTWTA